MREAVLGANGYIGRHLAEILPDAMHIGRGSIDLRMLPAQRTLAPACDILYLCAGANGAKACEGNQDSFIVNVDAPIFLAEKMAERGGFMVFISSMSIEWLDTAYQRQKLAAETVLRTMPNVGIVRAGRVVDGNIDDLCATMLKIGRNRLRGVTRWGNDDIAYRRT